MSGEITEAEYDAEQEQIEWSGVTSSGVEVDGILSRRMFGPDIAVSDESMQKIADNMPGKPLYDNSDGAIIDADTVQSIGVEMET